MFGEHEALRQGKDLETEESESDAKDLGTEKNSEVEEEVYQEGFRIKRTSIINTSPGHEEGLEIQPDR